MNHRTLLLYITLFYFIFTGVACTSLSKTPNGTPSPLLATKTLSSAPTAFQENMTMPPTLFPTPTPKLHGTIAFTNDSRIYKGIALLNLEDGTIHDVTGRGSYSLAWSPNGQWIAFNGGIPPSENNGILSENINIFTIKSDGNDVKQFTNSAQGKYDVNWSPDGKFIIYTYDNHVQPSDLALIDLKKNTTYLLTTTKSYESHPAWSPDGKQIAYLHRNYRDQPPELWIMDADGKNPTRLIELKVAFSRIDWSPDGQWIAFASSENSQLCGDVYILRPDGSELTRLTESGVCANHVVWSPDGTHLAFVDTNEAVSKTDKSQIDILDVELKHLIPIVIDEVLRINDIDWYPISN